MVLALQWPNCGRPSNYQPEDALMPSSTDCAADVNSSGHDYHSGADRAAGFKRWSQRRNFMVEMLGSGEEDLMSNTRVLVTDGH